jgi:hypothetical protein
MPTENVAHRLIRQQENLDLPRHARCDRSPTRDSLSPSARLTVLLPHPFAVDRLVGEFSIRRTFRR